MKSKILFLILVLTLLVGCQSNVTPDVSDNSVTEDGSIEETEEEFSEDLDAALVELDELENL